MIRILSSWHVVLVAAVIGGGPSPVAAQVFIGNGGMSINGIDLSAYGGVSSVEVIDSYSGSGEFVSGVIGPYGPGWGAGPVGPYFGSPYYGGPYGAGFGYGGFGYGYGGPYWGGGFYTAPLVIPAETMYGPSAVRRMMGLDPPLGTPIINQTTIVTPAPKSNNTGFGVNATGGVPAVPNVRVTNAPTRARAQKMIDGGDTLFQQQKLAEALAAYKDASRAAPDLADAYFRQAAAAVALGRYDDAVASIKFGLRLAPQWVDGPFRFAALYGPAVPARDGHVEMLDRTVQDRPTSNLLFLYGVVLFFDDAPRRSEPYFVRARALAVGETWHIELFQTALDRLPPDAAPQKIDAAKPIVPAPPVNAARDI